MIVEFVILITTSALVCHVCCCCCAEPSPQQQDTTAVYVPSRKLESGESVVHVPEERGEQMHKYQMKRNQETILDYDKFTQPFKSRAILIMSFF